MNIGIVTFHRAANYGAVLQAFALQTFLRQAGHSPFLVDHHYGSAPETARKRAGFSLRKMLADGVTRRRHAVFAEFRRRYLAVSETSYRSEQALMENPPAADAYICGSDQIWNPRYLTLPKDERASFLGFGETEVRRIAYAASLGVSSLAPEWSRRLAEHLQRFDRVGVREKDAVRLIAGLGRSDVVWTPDPTLLLPAEVYERILPLIERDHRLVYSYILHPPASELVRRTRECICRCLSLPYIETFKRGVLRVLCGGGPDPCQWLSTLKSAQFVVTNSFHGAVFSLLFRRPFIVLPLEGASAGMNGRMESLLHRVGLADRFVTQYDSRQITQLCTAAIDWDAVAANVRAFAAVGSAFLGEALSTSDGPPRGGKGAADA
ncbi:MAG: polysaccharide pyruvyl transferase family protein [Planctomycetes bacterium]|jgi:hypothetical protein|nr:polysaccharide pyruvyl transferase family protein [Planctomycetota bacterium]